MRSYMPIQCPNAVLMACLQSTGPKHGRQTPGSNLPAPDLSAGAFKVALFTLDAAFAA